MTRSLKVVFRSAGRDGVEAHVGACTPCGHDVAENAGELAIELKEVVELHDLVGFGLVGCQPGPVAFGAKIAS